MPAVPTAWAGKIPDLAALRHDLQGVLKILTLRADGSLAIPEDSGVQNLTSHRTCGHVSE